MALDDTAHALITPRRGSASFSAPDVRTIISHYRALGMITQLATQDVVSAASFNYVLASLFCSFYSYLPPVTEGHLYGVLLEAEKQTAISRLFEPARSSMPTLLSGVLGDEDKHLLACLEHNELPQFFAALDKLQAQRCRTLRSRP